MAGLGRPAAKTRTVHAVNQHLNGHSSPSSHASAAECVGLCGPHPTISSQCVIAHFAPVQTLACFLPLSPATKARAAGHPPSPPLSSTPRRQPATRSRRESAQPNKRAVTPSRLSASHSCKHTPPARQSAAPTTIGRRRGALSRSPAIEEIAVQSSATTATLREAFAYASLLLPAAPSRR